jgi:hypothetical protein
VILFADPGRGIPCCPRNRQHAFSPFPLIRINSAHIEAGLALRSATISAASGHLERLRR